MTAVERADVTDKGLAHDSVGLLGSIVLALSSVAPAYALTATLGPTVTEVGVQMPAVFLIGFLPMLLVAYAYRGLNQRSRTPARPSRGRSRRSARISAGCADGGW